MATPFAMTPSARTWFFSWLEGEFPREVSRYRELFSWRDHLPPRQRELVMAPFERLRLEAGFPRATAGRG